MSNWSLYVILWFVLYTRKEAVTAGKRLKGQNEDDLKLATTHKHTLKSRVNCQLFYKLYQNLFYETFFWQEKMIIVKTLSKIYFITIVKLITKQKLPVSNLNSSQNEIMTQKNIFLDFHIFLQFSINISLRADTTC